MCVGDRWSVYVSLVSVCVGGGAREACVWGGKGKCVCV